LPAAADFDPPLELPPLDGDRPLLLAAITRAIVAATVLACPAIHRDFRAFGALGHWKKLLARP
jgi:hypothetical protein